MTKLIIANWKAHPSTLTEAQELFRAEIIEAAKYKNIQTIICPPTAFLEELSKIDGERLGMQDFDEKRILKNASFTHALVGHSDRRYPPVGGGETDELINKKIKAALEAEVIPVLLVGEKNRGDDRRQVLEKQLSLDLDGLDPGQISKVLIAYEPVWAISTTPDASPSATFVPKVVLGKPDTPESTLEALKMISEFLSTNYQLPTTNYLYGGSVTEKNVADFLSHPEISGAVIGGASLRKDEFAEILRIVSEIE